MAVNITNFGVLNYKDNHREYNIHTSGNNIADIIRHCEAEEIQAEDVMPKTDAQKYFPLLTEQCLKEGKTEKVETELSIACKGSATCLWKAIHINEALGYIATNHLDAQEVYDAFSGYFGKLPYTERNFRGARYKNQ